MIDLLNEVQRYALKIQRTLLSNHRRSTRQLLPPPPPPPCLTSSLTGYYWHFTFH